VTDIVKEIARALDVAREQRSTKEGRVRQWGYESYGAYCADPAGRWARRKNQWFGEWADRQLGPNPHPREMQAGGVCCERCKRGCGHSGHELHHLTYDRLGHERYEDLVPLCPDCHQMIEAWISGTDDWRFLLDVSNAPQPVAERDASRPDS
jgi:5-methylcytosine-specific restriction endonuclease McrA